MLFLNADGGAKSNPHDNTPPSATMIIDNGDDGYSSTGFHAIPDAMFPDPEGCGGDIENSQKGTGADVATWTFSDLTAGTYRVSATWSAHENRATNAPSSIIDGATSELLVKTLVNQEIEPDDFFDDGSAWEDLGVVTMTGDTPIVELSDEADPYVTKASRGNEDANVDDVRFVATSPAGPPNALPIADAGGSYVIDESSSVTLDASASSDADRTIVSYELDLDNDGQYDGASGVTGRFSSNQDGVHTVGLRVTDDAGGSSTDTAHVTVNNLPPTADADGPYPGSESSNIVLDGSASTDPADDIVSYDWDFDGDGSYDDASGVSVAFNLTENGVFDVGLRVTDDANATSTSAATLTVSNVAPTADAGGPYNTTLDADVTLGAGDDQTEGKWLGGIGSLVVGAAAAGCASIVSLLPLYDSCAPVLLGSCTDAGVYRAAPMT